MAILQIESKFGAEIPHLKIAGCGTQEPEVGDCLQLEETTQEQGEGRTEARRSG